MEPQDPESRPMPDHNAWPPFSLPWDDNLPGPTDMSFLLDRPAGAAGFIQVAGGHLALGDGQRWRIWGQNLTFGAALLPTDMAPAAARRLAKYGINCIRLHHMDHRWPGGILLRHSGKTPLPSRAPGGVAQRDFEPTRALDPEAMARLDYFIACCKDNGVYIDLNLNVSRPFTAADGVKQVDWIGYGKALTYFDPQLIRLQKEYATQLLEHVNPFTGCRYAEEPAVALIELVNENSLLESWVKGRLRGQQTTPAGTWCDIPPAYAADLDRLWNDWLARKYTDRAALLQAWKQDLCEYEDPARGSVRRLQPEGFAAASAGRFYDEATFYAGLEQQFFEDMAAYLRGELGAGQVILGTSDHNHSIHGTLHVENNARLGIVDGHVYWQHPRFPNAAWSRTEWTISNSPMVDAPDHSAPAQLSRSRVAGLPYIVSELNEPFPNDYAAEFIPLTAAYALLQDWDGLFWFDYGGGAHESQWRNGAISSFFSMANDPVKMVQTAAGALTFLRGDVRAAEQLVERHLTHERVIDSLRLALPDDTFPYELAYIPGRLALIHRTAIADFHASSMSPTPDRLKLPDPAIASDTGELIWEDRPGDGRVTVDTPRCQACVGRAGHYRTVHLDLDLETPFAAVQLIGLDEKPLARAERMLLVTAARSANTDMQWLDDTRTSLGDRWGHAPTRIEPVSGTLRLRGLDGVSQLTLQPLDERGQPVGTPLAFEMTEGGGIVTLPGDTPTLWYLVLVQGAGQ